VIKTALLDLTLVIQGEIRCVMPNN